MKTVQATKARDNLFQLLKEVVTTHDPIQVQTKQGFVVMLSQEDWEAIEETLYLDSIPGVGDSIVEGMQASVDECSSEVEW